MRVLVASFLSMLLVQPAFATTIAWDGHILAADTQRTMGDRVKMRTRTKIHYSEKRGEYIGLAGEVVTINKVVSWFMQDPATAGPCPKGEFMALVVDKTGKCTVYAKQIKEGDGVETNGPYAIGTGSDFAMGAMKAGASAPLAVAVAGEYDLYTNKDVKQLTVVP